jgi:hypothetical protein
MNRSLILQHLEKGNHFSNIQLRMLLRPKFDAFLVVKLLKVTLRKDGIENIPGVKGHEALATLHAFLFGYAKHGNL